MRVEDFLGIEVAQSGQSIVLSQRKYVLDMLSETIMLDLRLVYTPIVQNHGLGEFSNQTLLIKRGISVLWES